MGYADSNLMQGETIVYRAHLHWKIFIRAGALVLAGLVWWIALAIVRSVLDGGKASELLASGWLMIPSYLLWLGAAASGVANWIKRKSAEFVVTNLRILIKTGLVRRDSQEMLLEKIENIAVEQGILERLINAGEIVFTGTGGSTQTYDDIQGPLELRRRVQEAITKRHQPA